VEKSVDGDPPFCSDDVFNALQCFRRGNPTGRPAQCSSSILVRPSENFCTQLWTAWRDRQCSPYMGSISLWISFASIFFCPQKTHNAMLLYRGTCTHGRRHLVTAATSVQSCTYRSFASIKLVLLSSGDSFPHLIQKRRSQLGFVTYLLNYPRIRTDQWKGYLSYHKYLTRICLYLEHNGAEGINLFFCLVLNRINGLPI